MSVLYERTYLTDFKYMHIPWVTADMRESIFEYKYQPNYEVKIEKVHADKICMKRNKIKIHTL